MAKIESITKRKKKIAISKLKNICQAYRISKQAFKIGDKVDSAIEPERVQIITYFESFSVGDLKLHGKVGIQQN